MGLFPGSGSILLFSDMFHLVGVTFGSPVPQALRVARHTEAVPVVGEVAVNKQNGSVHSPPRLLGNPTSKVRSRQNTGDHFQPFQRAAILKITVYRAEMRAGVNTGHTDQTGKGFGV